MTVTLPATPEANPKLSATEVGKRFLKLLDGLTSVKDLSVDQVERQMGLKLSPSADGQLDGATGDLGGGWIYALNYRHETLSTKRGVDLNFLKGGERFAEMSSVCELDFNYYSDSLQAMGFVGSPTFGEIGQLQDWTYTKFAERDRKNDVNISIIPQNVVAGEPGRLCVVSIGTLN